MFAPWLWAASSGNLRVNDTELLNQIATASDAVTVWDLAVTKFASLGFARANYGFTRFRSERFNVNPDDALFLSSAGEEFHKHYFRNNFFSRTPLFRWAVENEGACTWAWVRRAYLRGELTEDEAATVRENIQLGITAGITVSFPMTSSRAKGALGLLADAEQDEAAVEWIFKTRGPELLAVAHMMHLKLTQLPIPRRRPLTARQRETLEWVADGKTTQDVAAIMEVSSAMIEKHLRLAREALGVDTTAQAVAKAAMLNLIFQRSAGPQVGNPLLS